MTMKDNGICKDLVSLVSPESRSFVPIGGGKNASTGVTSLKHKHGFIVMCAVCINLLKLCSLLFCRKLVM